MNRDFINKLDKAYGLCLLEIANSKKALKESLQFSN